MWAAFRATPAKPIENATRGPAGGGSPLKKRLDAGEVLQPVERKVLNRSPTPEAAAFLTLNGLILLTGEGPSAFHIHGQILVGAVVAGVAAYAGSSNLTGQSWLSTLAQRA